MPVACLDTNREAKCMVGTTISVHDDTRFFEQALQEYREAVGDYSNFPDLCDETQHQVLERAQQLKDYELSKSGATQLNVLRYGQGTITRRF